MPATFPEIAAQIPVGLLNHADACIVEEQPDHLVLAVKIPRAAIRANHALLACLSERVEGPANGRPWRFKARHAARPRWATKSALWAFMVASIGGGVLAHQASAVPEPPHKNIHVELVKSVIEPDSPLEIRFTSHRTRLCKADLERIVLDATGTPVHARRQTGIGQAVTPAPITRTVKVPLPHGLEPGKYTYRSTVFSDCGGDIHAAPIPDLAFEIRI